MCCWEHYLWYFSHMKGFWTRSIFKTSTLRFIDFLKCFSTSLNSSDEHDKETRLYCVLNGIDDQFDGKWLSFAFACCVESILPDLPQQQQQKNMVSSIPLNICRAAFKYLLRELKRMEKNNPKCMFTFLSPHESKSSFLTQLRGNYNALKSIEGKLYKECQTTNNPLKSYTWREKFSTS